MFMGDFGHIKIAVKCKLFTQYCCSYYGVPLWDLQSKSVRNICIAWRKTLIQLWGLAPLTHGDIVSLLSDRLSVLVNLKQRFTKFIRKAINHMSPVISSVAKLSIQNPWSNISYEYQMLTTSDTVLKHAICLAMMMLMMLLLKLLYLKYCTIAILKCE